MGKPEQSKGVTIKINGEEKVFGDKKLIVKRRRVRSRNRNKLMRVSNGYS
ncbi:hypothetical protein KEH51_24780 [[Brevibacterium] frigoritolerans]|uniref:Uncharacterized protein n=1 Tax=Peribacillus frigoritolerans TaxID=450367 RepID=A0A941J7S4_9BACI|nr:hypothetical protein [Peribacillus frigoritolerans]